MCLYDIQVMYCYQDIHGIQMTIFTNIQTSLNIHSKLCIAYINNILTEI